MDTEVKTQKWTPGTLRAVQEIQRRITQVVVGIVSQEPHPLPDEDLAQIISRETHDQELAERLRELLTYLPDRNDALNYAATNDGRVGSVHVAVSKAQALLSTLEKI